jgi:FtsH-binding integral membrane protein
MDSVQISAEQHIYRAYNLMVTTVIFFAGIAFGGVIFSETDPPDMVDDAGLLAVGLFAVLWYRLGWHRYRRSIVPTLLAVLALLVQLAAVPLEREDEAAFGDNIGGLVLFGSFAVFVIYQYRRAGLMAARARVEREYTR